MRRSCRTRGQGNSRKQTTRRVPRERWTSLQLSLVRISMVEQQALRQARALPETSEALTRHPPTPSMDEETRAPSHNNRHARRLNHRTLRRSHARSSVEVTNRGVTIVGREPTSPNTCSSSLSTSACMDRAPPHVHQPPAD